MIFVGRASLEKAMGEYVGRYQDERSHQGLGNELPSGAPVQREGRIEASDRLGGMPRYYYRQAA